MLKKIAILTAALLTMLPVIAQENSDAPSLRLDDCRIRVGEGFPGIKARCGEFERSENPADPDSPAILLHVAIVSALTLEPCLLYTSPSPRDATL